MGCRFYGFSAFQDYNPAGAEGSQTGIKATGFDSITGPDVISSSLFCGMPLLRQSAGSTKGNDVFKLSSEIS